MVRSGPTVNRFQKKSGERILRRRQPSMERRI